MMDGRWLALGFCALSPLSVAAEGLDMPRADESTDYLSPKTMAEAHPQWRPASGQAGAAMGGFLAWPTLGAGILVDSNPLQAHQARRADTGARLTPRFVAERESGVHDTVLYGEADALLYASTTHADQFEGRLGALHDWAIARDFILRAQADLTRSIDEIDNRQVVTGRAGGRPFAVTDTSVAGSAQKGFGPLFVSLAGSASQARFDDTGTVRTTNGRPALSSQSAFTLTGRTGYWLAPAVFAFAEPAANWRVLDAVDQRSDGTRVVAGLGADRIGLLSGELYGGVQEQHYPRAPRSVEVPVVGGRATWSPTGVWTVTARFDRRLDQAAVGTVAEPLGTPIDVKAGSVSLRYAPAAAWAIEARLQREAIDYLGTRRTDQLYAVDGALTYACRHDLDLTGALRFTRVESSVALASYRRAMATLGAVYRY